MQVNTLRSNRPLVFGFDQELPTELADEAFGELARWHLDQLSESGWLLGAEAAGHLAAGDYPSLYRWDPDTTWCLPDDAFHLNQVRAFFSKRGDIDLGIDKKAKALESFWKGEELCAATNALLFAYSRGWCQIHPDVDSVLYGAQQKICTVLSDAAPKLSEIRPRFGPGASTQTPKKNACVGVKLSRMPACAANTPHPWVSEMLEGWVSGFGDVPDAVRELNVPVHASEVKFVPKNAKTLRAICKEPQLNSFYQLGVGDILTDILRRKVGIDLRDQSKNQRAARYGSIGGRFATVDLSMASDTVAWRLVQHLLPQDWFDLLWGLSTRETVCEGKVVWLEKMSTMGNGFTFPLETLIFWAIAQTCADLSGGGKSFCYGDDIVAPTAAVPLLLRSLHVLGFIPNPSKSFWDGPFRESCGKDYIFGTDVRPCFMKGHQSVLDGETVSLLGSDLFTLHNFYVRKGLTVPSRFVESLIDPSIRTRGPDGYGDGHLIGVYIPKASVGHGCVGYRFDTWTHKTKHLADEVLSRFAEERRREYVRQTRRGYEQLVYYGNRLAHVMRIATYLAYIREDTESASLRENVDPLYYPWAGSTYPKGGGNAHGTLFPDPIVRTDYDVWATPGKGALYRTSVYTFEPYRV